MKKKLLFLLCFLYFSNISAQYDDSTSRQEASILYNKANKQRSAGWILLGGGAGVAVAGLVIGASSFWPNLIEGDHTGIEVGGAMMITGLAGIAGSIPFFIASGKNKRKAEALVFIKMENSSYVSQYSITKLKYPAITLSISF